MTKKEPILYLCHRIPFPPNKGDKIRSFNILKALSQDYEVHLGCFVDDPYDWQYQNQVKGYCIDMYCLGQNKTLAKLKGLSSLLSNKPITLPYYYNSKMAKWVNHCILEKEIRRVYVYSSSMAQYVEGKNYANLHRVIDFVDVDSDKWRQYADKKTGLSRWVYHRESTQLGRYEDRISRLFQHCLFVSEDEASLFRKQHQQGIDNKIHGMLNGVDTDFFSPYADFKTPPELEQQLFLSFTGAMNYWANVDAVAWFVENVWHHVLTQHPQSKFYIVGGNPTAKVKSLTNYSGVIVTGRVHDIRPYIHLAKAVVAPMHIARGIQNKVLEAMSLDKPVIATSMAMEGINAPQTEQLLIRDDAISFSEACSQLLARTDQQTVSNRQWILTNFTWMKTLSSLREYLGFAGVYK